AARGSTVTRPAGSKRPGARGGGARGDASGVGARNDASGVGAPRAVNKDRFIAHSASMRALVGQIRRFAATDSNVLITGETGTGKNAVARQLHASGPRAQLPYITIDCASLPASLIDSELFGHERGAFTDAVSARAGRFELAG